MKPFTSERDTPLAAAIILSAFPILILAFLLAKYAVNIPVADQWDIIYLFEKYDAGDLSFFDFWAQHNEHRLIFPKILMLLLGIISQYNVLYEIWANVIISFLTYLLLVCHIEKNIKIFHIKTHHRILGIIFSFYIFSLIQYQNWLWGFGLPWFLNMFAVVAGSFIIANYPLNLRTFFLLVFFGILATFSLANGILYWLIILLFIIIYAIKCGYKKIYLTGGVWTILFIGVLFAYLHDYQKPSYHPDVLFFLKDPISFGKYISTYIGAPLAWLGNSFHQATLFGIFGIILSAIFFFRTLSQSVYAFQKSYFFFFISLYGILNAILTAIGRSGFRVDHALASRYTTVSIGFWISLSFFIYTAYIDKQNHSKSKQKFIRLCKNLVFMIIFFSLNANSYFNVRLFYLKHNVNYCGQDAVLYGNNPDALKFLYPEPERLMNVDIPRLKKLRLSIFRDQVPDLDNLTTFRFNREDWRYDDGWSIKGTYPDDDSYYFGSWDNPKPIGVIQSKPVMIDKPVFIRMLVSHCPDISFQKVGVRIEGEEPVEMLCNLNFDAGIGWIPCMFDLASYVSRSFSVFAEDRGSASTQCVGFVQPVLLNLGSKE